MGFFFFGALFLQENITGHLYKKSINKIQSTQTDFFGNFVIKLLEFRL